MINNIEETDAQKKTTRHNIWDLAHFWLQHGGALSLHRPQVQIKVPAGPSVRVPGARRKGVNEGACVWQVCEGGCEDIVRTEGDVGREPHHRDTTSLQWVSSEDKRVTRDQKQMYLVQLRQHLSLDERLSCWLRNLHPGSDGTLSLLFLCRFSCFNIYLVILTEDI